MVSTRSLGQRQSVTLRGFRGEWHGPRWPPQSGDRVAFEQGHERVAGFESETLLEGPAPRVVAIVSIRFDQYITPRTVQRQSFRLLGTGLEPE